MRDVIKITRQRAVLPDFMMKHKSFSRGEVARPKSRDTVLLGLKENFGMGKELGGGNLNRQVQPNVQKNENHHRVTYHYFQTLYYIG